MFSTIRMLHVSRSARIIFSKFGGGEIKPKGLPAYLIRSSIKMRSEYITERFGWTGLSQSS